MFSFTFLPIANLERQLLDQCTGGIPFISEYLTNKDVSYEEEDYDYDNRGPFIKF